MLFLCSISCQLFILAMTCRVGSWQPDKNRNFSISLMIKMLDASRIRFRLTIISPKFSVSKRTKSGVDSWLPPFGGGINESCESLVATISLKNYAKLSLIMLFYEKVTLILLVCDSMEWTTLLLSFQSWFNYFNYFIYNT